MRADAASSNMPLMYASVFICGLVTAAVLALIIGHIADGMEMTAAHGAIIGLTCWLGFAATTSYGSYLFSMKPRQLWLIDTMYNLVSFVLAGIILAVWR
jgi:predicted membrane chloride channel (bestrophin family)